MTPGLRDLLARSRRTPSENGLRYCRNRSQNFAAKGDLPGQVSSIGQAIETIIIKITVVIVTIIVGIVVIIVVIITVIMNRRRRRRRQCRRRRCRCRL